MSGAPEGGVPEGRGALAALPQALRARAGRVSHGTAGAARAILPGIGRALALARTIPATLPPAPGGLARHLAWEYKRGRLPG